MDYRIKLTRRAAAETDLLVAAVPAPHGAVNKALALQPLEDAGDGGVGEPQLLLDVLLYLTGGIFRGCTGPHASAMGTAC